MAKSSFSNHQAEFSIQHRALCEEDNFKGPWRDTVDAAKKDARTHRSEPGNRDHVIRIITQQSVTGDN